MAERGWNVLAAGAAGAGALVVARRRRSSGGRAGDGEGREGAQAVHAITVLGSVDEVARAWREQGGVDGLDSDVSIDPAPGGRGTEVRVRLDQSHMDGARNVQAVAERLQGDAPSDRVRRALRTFKAQVECGEVVTTEGQPTGRTPRQEAATRAVTDRLRSWGAG